MSSKYNLEMDWDDPIETNIEFLNKAITDLRNRKYYLKKLKKTKDEKELSKQIDIETSIKEIENDTNTQNTNQLLNKNDLS